MTFIPLPNADIPIMINFSITQILQAQSAYKKGEIQNFKFQSMIFNFVIKIFSR